MSPKNPTIQFDSAARHYRGEPHQDAAWHYLQEKTPPEVIAEFAALYRAGPDPKPKDPPWFAPALAIIREFEGCRLDAYQCPSGVWTIGWGATRMPVGGAVRRGDRITQAQADVLLDQQVRDLYGPGTASLFTHWKRLAPCAQAALISWAFNVGLSAVEESTLRRRLNTGEDPNAVAREELPRWNKGANGVLDGLTRRRAAEVALFTSGATPAAKPKSAGKPGVLSPFATKLSPHFSLGEFAIGQSARRFREQHQVDTAVELAAFLEKMRTAFKGRPVVITSGYRPPEINRSVGGASGSEHLYDAPGVGAVDVYVEGASIADVQKWVDREWPYSVGYGAPKGFVHIGIRKGRPRVRWDY